MKKKGLWILLIAVVLLISAVPAMADEYTTLPTATGNVIDLGGNTYTLSAQYKQTSGSVTIKNGTITSSVTDLFEVSGGTLTLGEGLKVNCTSSGLYAHNGGIINIDGATVIGTGNDYSFAYATGSGSQINISSGSLVKNGSNHVTLSIDQSASSTISGGTVSNNMSTAIVAKGSGTITVSGGTVTTTANMVAGYAVSGGKITVSGGTVDSGNWAALSAIRFGQATGGTIEVTGGTVKKAVGAYEGSDCKVIVSGGEIGTTDSWGMYVNNGASGTVSGGTVKGWVGAGNQSGTLKITGGVFSSDPTSYVGIVSWISVIRLINTA